MPWAPDYVDADELTEFVRVSADNPYVGTYGTAAARSIDDYCNRQFGRLEEAAPFTYPCWRAGQLPDGSWLVDVDDIPASSGITVTVDGTAVAAGVDGYRLWPGDAIAKGTPATSLRLADRPTGDVVISTRFGWLAIPAGVTAAMWLQVNRWHMRRESPYGIAGSTAEGGQEVRLSARLDPDVRQMLSGAHLVRARMPA